jgi:cyclopropane-fatty-acyl-phospholipid synthase
MDRLLRMAFEKLIRAGNLQVSTAGGSTFTFGDGRGGPVAIRFTSGQLRGASLSIPSSDSAKPIWMAAS